MLISAHSGYPRLLDSGADFIEIDVRRDERGEIIDSHDEPGPAANHALLDEILEAVTVRGLGLHLDMKEAGFEGELMGRVLARLPGHRVVATPDYEESIQMIKRNYPEVRVSPVDFIVVEERNVNRSYARPLWVWTVDDRRLMKRLLKDPRVECLITNRPDLAVRLRKARW